MIIKMQTDLEYRGSAGVEWKGEIELINSDIAYTCEIKAITNPTSGKSNSWLDKVVKISTGNEVKDKKILSSLNRMLYKLFLSIDMAILERETQAPEISQQREPSKDVESFMRMIQTYGSFTVTESKNIILTNLTNEEVKEAFSKSENKSTLYNVLLIDSLISFVEEWNALIENEALEREFQNSLMKYTHLFPIILGVNGLGATKEEKSKEANENHFDISNEDWIIELKRSKTQLFTTTGTRNNISGISSIFASADNQLDLYIKKKNRSKDLFSSFTKGILIIGESSQIDNDEKEFAFMTLKEKSRSEIILFDEVLKRAKKIIETITVDKISDM